MRLKAEGTIRGRTLALYRHLSFLFSYTGYIISWVVEEPGDVIKQKGKTPLYLCVKKATREYGSGYSSPFSSGAASPGYLSIQTRLAGDYQYKQDDSAHALCF